MLNNILKKYHIIVIPFFFAVAGYFYNKYSEDNWHYRYEVKKSFPAIIYLYTLDEEMVRLMVSDSTHKKFKDAVGPIIAENQYKIREDFPSLKNLILTEKYINFRPESNENMDKVIEEIINKLNEVIKNGLNERLKVYTDNAIELLRNKKEIKIKELERKINFYSEKKITPLSLSPTTGITIDNYLLDQKDEESKELVRQLKAELIDYEYYNAIHRFELTVLELKATTIYDNINLVTVNGIKNTLNNTEIIINLGLNQKFNTKPKMILSVLSFSAFGFFISVLITFLVLNAKFLKLLKLEKLLTLRSPK